MDKYWFFRKTLDFLADYAEVTDADMNYCGNRIRVCGENDVQTITIDIEIVNKEEEKDGN
jgi:hypothetical protein